MKIKSTKLTAIVMARRDELRQQALALRTNAEKEFETIQEQIANLLKEAKTNVHSARIQANRMEKEAELIQEALNEELEMQVKQQQEADKAWSVKGEHQLKAENAIDELMEWMSNKHKVSNE